jgi:hypothetical protein
VHGDVKGQKSGLELGSVSRRGHSDRTFHETAAPSLLGAFEKLQKNDYYIRHIFLSVRLSVRMEKFHCHWTDFDENLYLRFFRTFVEKIQVS